MAIAKAYGSITIVDISDLGTLSVYPESNQPYSVIYDPNTNGGTYSPNWVTSNLVLTPVIYYGNQNLTLNATNPKVTWTKRVGSSSVGLGTGESVSSTGVLTVSQNVLSSSNPIITYICTVQYTEPTTNQLLTAEGRITFSLISQPTTLKSCKIIGESVFLYNGSGTLQGIDSITLTAQLENCSITKWQYKNSSGDWSDINSTSSTLSVAATSNYFVGDLATIKLVTDQPDLVDIHVITKIRDGAAGDSVISAILSNEDQMLPADSTGAVASFDGAETTITIWEGSTDITNLYTITPTVSDNSITYTKSGYTYTITGFGVGLDSGFLTLTCERSGYPNIVKKFGLTKVRTGADGVSPTIYSLETSTVAVNKTIGGIYNPGSITLNAYSKTGNTTKTAYSGRFKIFLNNSSTATYTSSSDESTKSYTIPANTTSIVCVLYKSGSATEELDRQTIVVTSDGQTGANGAPGVAGTDAYNFVLGNYSDIIPCTTDKVAAAEYTITIPFTAYKGTSRVACTATYSTLPSGVTLKTNTTGTTTAGGTLSFTVAKSATLGGTTDAYNTGAVTITLTSSGVTNTQTYTWTKNIQAANGTNGADAVVLRAYAQKGGIITDSKDTDVIAAILSVGATDVTSNVTYQWAKFSGTAYVDISGATSSTYTVQAEEVNSYASYRCTAIYNNNTNNPYQAYVSILDKTDPLQATIYSSLGDKITNGVGTGVIYAKVYQNGNEIDALQNLSAGTTQPIAPTTGDYWAQPSNGVVTLKRWTGSSWVTETKTYDCTYTWSFFEQNSTSASTTMNGKFIYIDAELINKKVQINLEVTKN